MRCEYGKTYHNITEYWLTQQSYMIITAVLEIVIVYVKEPVQLKTENGRIQQFLKTSLLAC